MDSGSIITSILATVILGYGGYIMLIAIKGIKEGKCSSCKGCSIEGSCDNYKK